jgi:hypothetical protein
MIPDEIIQQFRERWAGTADELATALEAFYQDIRGTFMLALEDPPEVGTVGDVADNYFANYYGEDNIPQ